MSYSALDLQRNHVDLVGEYIFDDVNSDAQLVGEVGRILQNDEVFSSPFSKAVLSVSGEKSVLIPEALFEEGRESDYLAFSNEVPAGHGVHSNQLVNIRSRCIFSVSGELAGLLEETFPASLLMHSSTPLIDVFALRMKREEGRNVILHIQYSQFEMLVFEGAELNFYNSFSYTTAEDLLYYTLFVFEQLDLNHEKDGVQVYGEVDQYGNLSELLQRYLGKVNFGHRTDMMVYSPSLDLIPGHYYANLFHHFLCA